jgi:hypothetical protein
MEKDTTKVPVSMPAFAGYVLAAGALVWLTGGGILPLLVGALAVGTGEVALRRFFPTEPAKKE